MNRFIQTFKQIFAGLALGLYSVAPVFAADIEIYTSLSSNAVTLKPNVLFVLDTSGSMNSSVTIGSTPYDPNTTYSGCYDSSRVYYSRSGSPPSCFSRNWFYRTAFHCDSSYNTYSGGVVVSNDGPLNTAGFHTSQFAQDRGSYWSSIRTTFLSWRSRSVECVDDAGLHGNNTSNTTSRTYISNSSNWSSTDENNGAFSAGSNVRTVYSHNYLNYLNDPSIFTTSTRFIEVQKAINALVDSNDDINLALMGFDGGGGFSCGSGYDGGQVLFPMEDTATSKTNFKNTVNALTADSCTPLSETYFEALKYFGGEAPVYGDIAVPASVAGSYDSSGSKYETPIADTCQTNTIIFLTDGVPTDDNLTTSELSTLPGFTPSVCASTGTPSTANNCLDRLAGWAANNDVANKAGEPGHVGTQTITTHTIGFDFSSGSSSEKAAQALLQRTAAAGGGQFLEADNAASLTDALNQTLVGLLQSNTTFSSPAVSVNAFNRSTHLDDLYFTVFKPAKDAHWDGNLKKYKIRFRKDTDDFDDDSDTEELVPFIADRDEADAIDESTGFFQENALSYWTVNSDLPAAIQPGDGDEVSEGGAAERLTNIRNVYTITGSYTDSNGLNTPSNGDLADSRNALDKANADVTDALLDTTGLASLFPPIPYRDTLLDWATGIDVLDDDDDTDVTDARQIMGDPLHAEPALVQYGLTAGGEPDLTAYVATNDGYLHSIDTLTGKENWAFVPQELLANLNNVFDGNNAGAGGKSYGIDGNVVARIEDENRDGTISGSDAVWLYFGMRRGGDNIYAMDVTDRSKPQLKWVIRGGTGDFAKMGQSWSTVNVEKLFIDGNERDVLMFAGGYDEGQDLVNVRTQDTVGNAVYIVDANTGELLWSASNDGSADLTLSDMDYSIPGRVKPLDVDRDGYIDRIYFSDMGGQIWRINIPAAGLTAGNLANEISGYKLADLAEDSSINDVRRFYYPPDVALIVEQGKAPYLAVLTASGYRASPLNDDVHDRIYMIRDTDVYEVPTSTPSPITESDLFDTTDNAIGEGTDSQVDAATADLDSADGWYITLNELDGSFIGEKSLSEPLILDGVGIVTTFIPSDVVGATNDACTPREGTGSVFYINIADGTPTFDLSGNDANNRTRIDRKTFLKRGGIPPSPNIIVTEQGTAQCVGTECAQSLIINRVEKTIWHEQEI